MRVLFLAIAAVLASALSAGAEVPDTPVTIGSFKMLYPSQGLYGKISTNGLGSGKMTVHFYPIDMNGEPVGSFYGEFTNR